MWLAAGALAATGCRHEDKDDNRPNYWRAEIAIVGHGEVASVVGGFACTSDGMRTVGDCGPRLLAFHERNPPLLRATGSPGWRFDHWQSTTRHADGRVATRAGPMPDGRLYLNGFGYRDTGALETVTAVFVAVADGLDDATADRATR